jgi:uncharacterized membrane protein HdeD (DUF308 family)
MVSREIRGRGPRMPHETPECSTFRLPDQRTGHSQTMIILGVVLLLIGFLFSVPIIWTLGIIAVVIGAILALVGFAGHEIGGRRHYF